MEGLSPLYLAKRIAEIRETCRRGRKAAATTLSIIVLITLAILFAILAMGPLEDKQTHQSILTRLRSLDLNNASLQRDVLRARVGLLANYDPLVHSIVGLHNDVAALRSLFQHSETVETGDVFSLLDDIQASIDHDEGEVERFKTENALLHNSLRIFSNALADLQTNPSSGAVNAKGMTAELGNLMLQYSQGFYDQTTGLIAQNLNALSELEGTPVPDIKLVAIHGRLILSVLPQVRNIISAIQKSDTTNRAQRLQTQYLEVYGVANTRSQWSRVFLGTTSALLSLYVVLLVYRLRTQTDRLSRRLQYEWLVKEIGRCFEERDQGDTTFQQPMNAALDAVKQLFSGKRCRFFIVNNDTVTPQECFGDETESEYERDLLLELVPRDEPLKFKRIFDPVSSSTMIAGAMSLRLSEERSAFCILEFEAGRRRIFPDERSFFENTIRLLSQRLDHAREQQERKMLEKRLEHAERLQAVGTLAGGIAHEFNNILVAILGYAEMALDLIKQPSSAHHYVGEVIRATERSRHIIDQILTLSRKRERAVRPIDLVEVVRDIVTLLRVPLPAGVELITELPTFHHVVVGNPIDVQRLLMNLSKNASEAMSGSGRIVIKVSKLRIAARRLLSHGVLPAGDYVLLSVQDDGQGIPDTVLPHIFEPFFTTRAKSGGTGLGLAAVHGSVTALGGNIDVTSTAGHGTTFDIFLPASSSEPTAITEFFSEKSVPKGNGEVIFVLDENETARMSYEDQLAALGYEPVGYRDWQTLLKAAQEGVKPDLILIDEFSIPAGLPSSELRTRFGAIPFFLLAAHPEKLRVLSTGDWYPSILRKPVGSKKLAAAVRMGISQALHQSTQDGLPPRQTEQVAI
jgi:signal transduction histidine kinase/CheY-like chemotaxis protein